MSSSLTTPRRPCRDTLSPVSWPRQHSRNRQQSQSCNGRVTLQLPVKQNDRLRLPRERQHREFYLKRICTATACKPSASPGSRGHSDIAELQRDHHRTTITSNTGSYVFTALAAGTYRVEVSTAQPALAGCMLTKVNAAGSTTANDSNANPATALLLTNRSSDQTIDFGFITKPVTYTIGGRGTVPSGSNPGALLKLKFPTLYSTGAVIGGKLTLKFTSQYAIQLFLPQGGTPSKLAASMTNPVVSKGGGVLASQVMGYKLNVDFSNAGILPKGLGAMKFKNGLFSGKTVTQVLALANTALGGGSLPAGATYSDLSDAMALVNENFNDTSKSTRHYLQSIIWERRSTCVAARAALSLLARGAYGGI